MASAATDTLKSQTLQQKAGEGCGRSLFTPVQQMRDTWHLLLWLSAMATLEKYIQNDDSLRTIWFSSNTLTMSNNFKGIFPFNMFLFIENKNMCVVVRVQKLCDWKCKFDCRTSGNRRALASKFKCIMLLSILTAGEFSIANGSQVVFH